MSAERALLRRVKVLLECSNMEPLQRQTDLIVGEIKELLAQPESTAEAIMPNGVCVSNVYDAYEEGRKSVMVEQKDIYQKLLRIEEGLEVEILPSKLWLDGYETGKRTMQPEQELVKFRFTTRLDQEPVMYQYRAKLDGKDLGRWNLCNKIDYEDYKNDPTFQHWTYQTRKLLAEPEQEPLTNEQKSAEAEFEQAIKDTIDTTKLMQILKDGGILIEVGEIK